MRAYWARGEPERAVAFVEDELNASVSGGSLAQELVARAELAVLPRVAMRRRLARTSPAAARSSPMRRTGEGSRASCFWPRRSLQARLRGLTRRVSCSSRPLMSSGATPHRGWSARLRRLGAHPAASPAPFEGRLPIAPGRRDLQAARGRRAVVCPTRLVGGPDGSHLMRRIRQMASRRARWRCSA